jgi:hypothetical protein
LREKRKHTLRLKELQLTIQKLEVGLGEDDLWQTGFTRGSTCIARFGIVDLVVQGVVGGDFGRHCEGLEICM